MYLYIYIWLVLHKVSGPWPGRNDRIIGVPILTSMGNNTNGWYS